MKIDEFRLCLTPHPGDKYAARCSVCSKELTGVNRSALVKKSDFNEQIKIIVIVKGKTHFLFHHNFFFFSNLGFFLHFSPILGIIWQELGISENGEWSH